MEDKKNRKSIIYLVIGIVTLIALIAGATYAFFQAQTGNNAIANLNTTTGTTDNLTFTIEDLDVGTTKITDNDNTNKDIKINANQENFKEKGKSIGDGITGKAILVANNTTNETISYPYYVYVNIKGNGLKYSSYTKAGEEPKVYKTEEAKAEAITKEELIGYIAVPELVMIVKKNGEEYKETIEGLTKTTIITEEGKEANGYDITEKSGAILISEETIQVTKENHDEEQENIKTDEWEISIVLVNLNTDQELNTGKKVIGEVLIQKEKMKEALDILIADANKEGETPTIYYHDGVSTDSGSTLEAGDFSYRYSGASADVHNYVCFGGDCSDDPTKENYANLYRIIGMFPTEETKDSDKKTYQIKIIKADYTTEAETGGAGVGAYDGVYRLESSYKGKITTVARYYWNNNTNNNDWRQSNLNTKNLNEFYLNTYLKPKDNEKWYNMIEDDHIWITAGNTYDNIAKQNAKNAYDNEIKNPVVGTALSTAAKTYPARVGLMYISDSMYAATKESWTTSGSSYSSVNAKNWMVMGLYEWALTRKSDDSNMIINLDNAGGVSNYRVNQFSVYGYAVRPCLYLNSDVKIIDGDGTSTNPYILSE